MPSHTAASSNAAPAESGAGDDLGGGGRSDGDGDGAGARAHKDPLGVSSYFRDPDGDALTYTASSSAEPPAVVSVDPGASGFREG